MNIIGAPRRPEIDEYAIKFLIGAIAILLPLIEYVLTHRSITSISASFWFVDTWPAVWPRNIFVGFLFAIAAFLMAYNGKSEREMWLTKIAAVAALGIAMYPCECGNPDNEIVPKVHVIAAGVMFAVLACFCWIFIQRALDKKSAHGMARAVIYGLCGVGMAVAIVLLLISAATPADDALVFWGETIGLVSFGISWLTASKVLPVITAPAERKHILVNSKRQTTPEPKAEPV